VGRVDPNNWARHKPRKQWVDIDPKQLGWSQLNIFSSSLSGEPKHLGWAITDPAQEWIIFRTWTVSSRSACNFVVADGRVKWEATLWRRRSCCHWLGVKLTEVLVEEMVAVLVAGGGGRKMKKQKKKICRGEREDLAVATPSPVRIWVRGEAETPSVGGGEMFLWDLQGLKKQRGEREEREPLDGRKTGEGADFLRCLDPNFSSLKPWNPPLFIGGGKGQSCLCRGKIFSPWFDWKNPNRRFKVCTLNCQIWQSKAAWVGYFRPVTGAVLMFIGLNGWYSEIEGFQVTILVHVLSILGDIRGIKCTCKTAPRAPFKGKTVSSDQATRHLISSCFYTQNYAVLGLN